MPSSACWRRGVVLPAAPWPQSLGARPHQLPLALNALPESRAVPPVRLVFFLPEQDRGQGPLNGRGAQFRHQLHPGPTRARVGGGVLVPNSSILPFSKTSVHMFITRDLKYRKQEASLRAPSPAPGGRSGGFAVRSLVFWTRPWGGGGSLHAGFLLSTADVGQVSSLLAAHPSSCPLLASRNTGSRSKGWAGCGVSGGLGVR